MKARNVAHSRHPPPLHTFRPCFLTMVDRLCFEMLQGERKVGRDVMCGAQQAGYAREPWETVNYADCHDGQTLFDQASPSLAAEH